ncbi:MAG: hypothetical protein PVJ28_09150 [Acidimicrobiia bacterium]
MSSFDGRLHMPGYSRIPLGVEVDITDQRLTLKSGERRIGAWSLGELDIAIMSDGFHISLDEEEVVLSVFESERFISELGSAVRHPQRAMSPSTPSRSSFSPARAGDVALEPDHNVFDEFKRRIADLSVAVTMDSVAPAEVFGRWLRLLKELNLRHGQGSMPTPLFHRLNTQLLELIPEPSQPQPTAR